MHERIMKTSINKDKAQLNCQLSVRKYFFGGGGGDHYISCFRGKYKKWLLFLSGFSAGLGVRLVGVLEILWPDVIGCSNV